MEYSNELQSEIKYVQLSGYRTNVIKSLDGYPKMPTEIAKSVGTVPNNISLTLKHLKEHGLVECMNPEVRKGRLYRLTEKGRKVLDNLD